MTSRRAAVFVAWVLAVIAPVVAILSLGTATSAAPEIVGHWRQVSHCNKGWCNGQDFPLDFTIDTLDPATGALTGGYSAGSASGTFDGVTATITLTQSGYHSTSILTVAADGLSMVGTWTDSHKVGGTIDVIRTDAPPPPPPTDAPTTLATDPPTTAGPTTVPAPTTTEQPHGARPSAVLVICNRDLTKPVFATFGCNAFVADASGESPSVTPTGRVTWTATVGTFGGATSVGCDLIARNLGAAGCSVDYGASNEQVPIETAVPVTVSYAGDETFDASVGSDHLGPASDISQLETYGGRFDDQLRVVPGCDCGDPVDPGTGNLSLQQADVLVPGLGMPLGVIRTYNSGAAATQGRFGAGWRDTYDAHLSVADGSVTVQLASGASVAFSTDGDGYLPPTGVTATLRHDGDGYKFVYANQHTLSFDTDGRMTALSDTTGEVTTLEYDAGDGALVTVTDPSGRTLRFTHDAAGHVTSTIDPAERTTTYVYDQAGDLTTVTDVGGGVTTYGYDDAHHLVSTTSPAGNIATSTYDDRGRVVQQTDPVGNELTFEYRGSFPNVVTTTTDGNGRRSVFAFRQGALVSLTRASGTADEATTSYRYDDRFAVSAVVDPLGNLWRFTNDAAGNVTSSTDPIGRTTTWTYDDRNNVTSTTDALGRITTTGYDAHGLPIRSSGAVGTQAEAAIEMQRDAAHPGEVLTVTDPSGAVTTFEYDAQGDLVRETDATGGVSTATYDILGRQVSTVGPRGNLEGVSAAVDQTVFEYDAYGDVTKVTDSMGNVSTATYDANHNLATQTDNTGATTTFGYDADDRVVSRTFADGSSETATYDGTGNVLTVVDPSGAVMTTAYDALDRPSTRTDPLGRVSHLTHDANGNVAGLVDASGNTTTLSYDAAGQLVGVTYSDADTPPVTYTYDAAGQRATMTDGTGTTTYTYDELARLVTTTDGAGHTVAVEYDGRSNAVAIVYPSGLRVEHSYDGIGRLTSVRDGLGHTNSFTYGPDGALTGATLGDGTIVDYDRDDRRSLISITDTAANAVDPFATFTYGRDDGGSVSSVDELIAPPSIASSAAGASTADRSVHATAAYDPLHRLQSLGGATFGVDAAGRVTTLTGAGLAYDGAGQLLSSGPTTFAYDDDGRRVSAGAPGADATTYRYDGAGRLAQTVSPASTDAPVAPRSPVTHDDGGRSVWPFVAIGAALLALLALGAVVIRRRRKPRQHPPVAGPGGFAPPTGPASSARAFGGAAIALLIAVCALGGSGAPVVATAPPSVPPSVLAATPITTTYSYNGDGLRMASTSDGRHAEFTWANVNALPTLIGDGATQYVLGPGGTPLEQIEASGVATWLHTDQQGTVRALTDEAGTVTATFDYDVYGRRTSSSGTGTTAIGFHGQYSDAETGLHYLIARYYDPSTAQFLTVDPLVAITHQPYSYGAADPLNLSDPSGLSPDAWFSRPNQRTALAGHGSYVEDASSFVVPAGTWITFHAPPGAKITDSFGQIIEAGASTPYSRTFGPGSIIPDLYLTPPDGLHILPSSTTVSQKTKLSELLKPGMGNVDWAACRAPHTQEAINMLRASGEYRGPLWNENGSVLEDMTNGGFGPNPKYKQWYYGPPPDDS